MVVRFVRAVEMIRTHAFGDLPPFLPPLTAAPVGTFDIVNFSQDSSSERDGLWYA